MDRVKKNSGLLPLAFQPLPLGSIRPTGWLLRQLQIQADGLTGHLDEFWPDVADSGWIGGKSEGWERGPYWLDGLVPLAFLLDDARLKEKAHRWMDYILNHQHDDGWLGPVHDEGKESHRRQAHDPWPVFVVLKAMTQYEEATRDGRVIPTMQRFLRRLSKLLDEKPLFEWGKFRAADLALSIHWLYERTGEAWLLDLAATVRAQGFDWRAHFAAFPCKARTKREEANLITHVVNNAMAVKTPGVWFRQSRDPADRQAVFDMIRELDAYHGQATGLFTGDEHLAGKDPSQGTELCAVVEYLFSLEVLLSLLGEPRLADRLERIAFNALPATFKPDMWAHQYDQQANQVVCQVAEDRLYTNNGPDANLFGLEPNYGCCTANMHQGWPKFASHLWMKAGDGGLAAVALAPCCVEAQVAGKRVRIDVRTDYPFAETVKFTVRARDPVRFVLRLRVPAWADGAALKVGRGRTGAVEPGTFHSIEREWRGTTSLVLGLPLQVRVERRFNNGVAIHRGPLVYGLRIGEDWRMIRGQPPYGDWEVHPTTPWNYALALDEACPDRSLRFESRPVGDCPFSPDGAPVIARASGRRLPEWQLEHHAAGPLPPSPVTSGEPLEELTLIPYGCTNLRITEFPVLGA